MLKVQLVFIKTLYLYVLKKRWLQICGYFPSRDDFDPALLHPEFEPPHYELCTLRGTPSGNMAKDFEKFQKLRRSSSKCIRDHHCGSQQESVHGSRSNLSMRDATVNDGATPGPTMGQQSPHIPHHANPGRNIVIMKHSYSQEGAEKYRAEEDEDEEENLMDDAPTKSQYFMQHHQIHHEMEGPDYTFHSSLSNDLM